jgi:hypothetical protein
MVMVLMMRWAYQAQAGTFTPALEARFVAVGIGSFALMLLLYAAGRTTTVLALPALIAAGGGYLLADGDRAIGPTTTRRLASSCS